MRYVSTRQVSADFRPIKVEFEVEYNRGDEVVIPFELQVPVPAEFWQKSVSATGQVPALTVAPTAERQSGGSEGASR
jgi:hypothetical protein